MMDNRAQALKLKDEGNRHFSKKDYPRAESCYSQALVKDPTLTSLYTNRAMTRFHTGDFPASIGDCDAALSADADSIKAHYFKSKALLALADDVDAACAHARAAYEACRASDDRSLDMTMAHYLKCRSERWAVLERRRRREAQDLEREVLDILQRETDRDAQAAEEGVERSIVQEEGEKRAAAMRGIFERARSEDDRKKDVPEWLVDDISFNVMVDPVMTHTGRSYERASIQAAINNNAIDPVTREPLAKGELIPNIGLKRACEWYLDNNGWAYDW